MNRKIKLYTTLFVVTLIIYVITSVFHYNETSLSCGDDSYMEITGLPEAFAQRDSTNGRMVSRWISYMVYVKPGTLDGKVLMSHAGGQDWRVDMKQVSLEKPWTESDRYYVIIGIFVLGVVTCFFFWILCIVFKTVRSIRRGNIFVTDVSHRMETIGKLLVALYLIGFITNYILTWYCIRHIHLAGYSIVYHNDCNIMFIFTGLALMIISQVILMGKELKEEQELTI